MPTCGIPDDQAPAGVDLLHFGRRQPDLRRQAAPVRIRNGLGMGTLASRTHLQAFNSSRRAIRPSFYDRPVLRPVETPVRSHQDTLGPTPSMNSELTKRLAVRWGIPLSEVPGRLLRESIPWPQRLAFPVLSQIRPALFNEDRLLIADVLTVSNRAQIVSALRGMHRTPGQSGNFVRHALRIRASGRRLLRVAGSAFDPAPSDRTEATPS